MALAPWALSALGILVLWLIARGARAGWWLGFAADALYVAYFLATRQWGLLPACAAYTAVRIGYLRRNVGRGTSTSPAEVEAVDGSASGRGL